MRSVGAELFHVERRADGQADMTKPIISFRKLAKAPKHRNTLYQYRI
jgi:hypothetical protein